MPDSADTQTNLSAFGSCSAWRQRAVVVREVTMLSTFLVLLFSSPAAALLPSPRPLAPGNVLASLSSRALPALASRAAVASGAMAAVLHPHAAAAVEVNSGIELPNDSFVVGFAVLILVGTGLLNASLGDIVADEVSERPCVHPFLVSLHQTDARGPLWLVACRLSCRPRSTSSTRTGSGARPSSRARRIKKKREDSLTHSSLTPQDCAAHCMCLVHIRSDTDLHVGRRAQPPLARGPVM